MIAPDTLPESVQALVERFTAVGIRPVLKHAVTALGVVSTYAMGVDPDPGPASGSRRAARRRTRRPRSA